MKPAESSIIWESALPWPNGTRGAVFFPPNQLPLTEVGSLLEDRGISFLIVDTPFLPVVFLPSIEADIAYVRGELNFLPLSIDQDALLEGPTPVPRFPESARILPLVFILFGILVLFNGLAIFTSVPSWALLLFGLGLTIIGMIVTKIFLRRF